MKQIQLKILRFIHNHPESTTKEVCKELNVCYAYVRAFIRMFEKSGELVRTNSKVPSKYKITNDELI